MLGLQELLLQMDERARNLDEPLKKRVIFVAALKPEMLENVMRLVVLLRVEAGEKAFVMRVERRVRTAPSCWTKAEMRSFFFIAASLRPTNRKLQIANRKR